MEVFQIEESLKSIEIIVDTREQPSERAERRYRGFSVPYKRQKLNYGDYTYNFCINGKYLFDCSRAIDPDVVIERKENLAELSGNFCQNRDRFIREFERMKEHGSKIYLLVEDASWENLINGRYRTKYNPIAYEASIQAFMARYDVTPLFCKAETSGHLIKNILYRELKERLERGEYDWLTEDIQK